MVKSVKKSSSDNTLITSNLIKTRKSSKIMLLVLKILAFLRLYHNNTTLIHATKNLKALDAPDNKKLAEELRAAIEKNITNGALLTMYDESKIEELIKMLNASSNVDITYKNLFETIQRLKIAQTFIKTYKEVLIDNDTRSRADWIKLEEQVEASANALEKIELNTPEWSRHILHLKSICKQMIQISR